MSPHEGGPVFHSFGRHSLCPHPSGFGPFPEVPTEEGSRLLSLRGPSLRRCLAVAANMAAANDLVAVVLFDVDDKAITGNRLEGIEQEFRVEAGDDGGLAAPANSVPTLPLDSPASLPPAAGRIESADRSSRMPEPPPRGDHPDQPLKEDMRVVSPSLDGGITKGLKSERRAL